MPKATIERMPWQPTAGQRAESLRTEIPRRQGPLPLPRKAENGSVELDEVAVRLTHLNKIYFPGLGLSKRDVLDYYHDLAPFLLPHLRDRPNSLLRYPHGIEGESFFQKEAGEYLPAWIATAPLPSQGQRRHINYILCNDRPTLLYLVNYGCIDFHLWMSRAQTPSVPDFTLLDLDPGPQAGFAQVVSMAVAVRRVLERYGIVGVPKTSGATGIHIHVPLEPVYSYAQSAEFAAILLRLAAQHAPGLGTEVWAMRRRPPDRIYLDYRQNAPGKTVPPPYALRPRPGAPVSTPLQWQELNSRLKPAHFTPSVVRRRLDRYGDLFAAALPGKTPQSLAKILARMEAGIARAG